MGEKFKIAKKIESGLIFKHMDPYMARFEMDNVQGLLSRKVLEIDPTELFPSDFDVGKYEVTGKVIISVEIKEK